MKKQTFSKNNPKIKSSRISRIILRFCLKFEIYTEILLIFSLFLKHFKVSKETKVEKFKYNPILTLYLDPKCLKINLRFSTRYDKSPEKKVFSLILFAYCTSNLTDVFVFDTFRSNLRTRFASEIRTKLS